MPWLSMTLLLLALAGCALPAGSRSSASRPDAAARPEVRAQAAFLQAKLLAEDEDYAAALVALEEAAAADPASAYLQVALAEIHLQMGHDAQALAAAEEALRRDPRASDALLFLGNAAFAVEDYQRAADYYRQVLQIDPTIENAQLHLAVSLARTGAAPEAIDQLQKLLKQNPENVYAELALGRIYRESGALPEAEALFRHMLEVRPDLDIVQLELGLIYEARDDIPQALAAYRLARDANPENTAIRHRIARLLIRQRAFVEALNELQAIVEISPDDLDARRKIGLLDLELRRWDEAITVFKGILADEPDLPQVIFYLGAAEEGKGDLEDALTTFARIPRSSVLFADALTHRVLILQRLGRFGDAIALLEAEIDGPTQRVEHYTLLAFLYQEVNRPEVVLSVLDRGMARFPDHAELPYRKGLVLEQRGRHEEALALVRQALKYDADHAEALNFIAYAYAESGKHLDEALVMARRAVELKPAGHIYDTLGWVNYRLKRYKEARKALEKAVELLPDDEVVLEHLGDAYAALGLKSKAADAYQRSLERVPENDALRAKLKRLKRR